MSGAAVQTAPGTPASTPAGKPAVGKLPLAETASAPIEGPDSPDHRPPPSPKQMDQRAVRKAELEAMPALKLKATAKRVGVPIVAAGQPARTPAETVEAVLAVEGLALRLDAAQTPDEGAADGDASPPVDGDASPPTADVPGIAVDLTKTADQALAALKPKSAKQVELDLLDLKEKYYAQTRARAEARIRVLQPPDTAGSPNVANNAINEAVTPDTARIRQAQARVLAAKIQAEKTAAEAAAAKLWVGEMSTITQDLEAKAQADRMRAEAAQEALDTMRADIARVRSELLAKADAEIAYWKEAVQLWDNTDYTDPVAFLHKRRTPRAESEAPAVAVSSDGGEGGEDDDVSLSAHLRAHSDQVAAENLGLDISAHLAEHARVTAGTTEAEPETEEPEPVLQPQPEPEPEPEPEEEGEPDLASRVPHL